MSFIRPEVLDGLSRGREVILGGVVAALGIRLIWLGGYFYLPLGAAVLLLGCGWVVLAWRRMRFRQGGDAPGMVAKPLDRLAISEMATISSAETMTLIA